MNHLLLLVYLQIIAVNVAFVGYLVFFLRMLDRRDTRTLPKWGWFFVIVLLAPLGGLLYLISGRGAPTA